MDDLLAVPSMRRLEVEQDAWGVLALRPPSRHARGRVPARPDLDHRGAAPRLLVRERLRVGELVSIDEAVPYVGGAVNHGDSFTQALVHCADGQSRLREGAEAVRFFTGLARRRRRRALGSSTPGRVSLRVLDSGLGWW